MTNEYFPDNLPTPGQGQIEQEFSRRQQGFPKIVRGTASPTIIPQVVGDIFVDTNNKKVYFATGIASSSDWTVVN